MINRFDEINTYYKINNSDRKYSSIKEAKKELINRLLMKISKLTKSKEMNQRYIKVEYMEHPFIALSQCLIDYTDEELEDCFKQIKEIHRAPAGA